MLRKLTAEEIQRCVERMDVTGHAVMNTLADVNKYDDIRDAIGDIINMAYNYNWNDETIVAISLGIFMAGGVTL
ncbi:hypothetical protein KAX02_03525 [candidate division WOR-3 bacterium]|nr:hypothetical protein [candidate division WOR-3 bacterium]